MEDSKQLRSNRMVLLLIAGIPVTMILAATWLWYFVAQGNIDLVGVLGTANQGTLVQPPRQIADVETRYQDGSKFQYSDAGPKWTLVIPSSGATCDVACEQLLYVTRQIHVAMGKSFGRIGRMYLSEATIATTTLSVTKLTDGSSLAPSFAELLARDHRGLQPVVLPAGGYIGLFGEHARDPSTWYLVDPAGWIMMSYNSEIHYKDVISDLKFLVKNSSG